MAAIWWSRYRAVETRTASSHFATLTITNTSFPFHRGLYILSYESVGLSQIDRRCDFNMFFNKSDCEICSGGDHIIDLYKPFAGCIYEILLSGMNSSVDIFPE